MTSFPHSLVLNSQPCFGLTQSEFLNLYNFLINERIFIKVVAKCRSLQSLSSEFKDNLCNPIRLKSHIQMSLVRKPSFCICENNDAYQLYGKVTAKLISTFVFVTQIE